MHITFFCKSIGICGTFFSAVETPNKPHIQLLVAVWAEFKCPSNQGLTQTVLITMYAAHRADFKCP